MKVPGSKDYQGEWFNNLKHGVGFEVSPNGITRRKGEWKKGKMFRWLGKTESVATGQFDPSDLSGLKSALKYTIMQ